METSEGHKRWDLKGNLTVSKRDACLLLSRFQNFASQMITVAVSFRSTVGCARRKGCD